MESGWKRFCILLGFTFVLYQTTIGKDEVIIASYYDVLSYMEW